MASNQKNKAKRIVGCLCLASVTAAGLYMLAIYAKNRREGRAKRRASDTMTLWSGSAACMSASEAKVCLNRVCRNLGDDLKLVPPAQMGRVHRYLGYKFFAEEAYEKAFAELIVSWQLSGKRPVNDRFTAYVAGMALKDAWLADQMRRMGKGSAYRRFFRLCRLWAEGRYADVAKSASARDWTSVLSEASSEDNWSAWLQFMRIRALMELGQVDQAWAELNRPIPLDKKALLGHRWFFVHYVETAAVVAEKSGHSANARRFASAVKDVLDRTEEASWRAIRQRIAEMLRRLGAQSAGTAASATSRRFPTTLLSQTAGLSASSEHALKSD